MRNLRAFRFIKLFLTGWLLVSCSGGEPPSPEINIPETWMVRDYETDNLDSLAFWQEKNWLLATAKSTHEIVVLNAAAGRLVQRFGGPGVEAGQLMRPNGIAAAGDVLFVVERDNHRVQMFSLPECRSLGFFGSDRLKRPYGIALYEDGDERIQIYVTDNHQPDNPTESDLRQRVKHFEIEKGPDGMEAKWIRSFGDSDKPGALYKVESIAVDPEFNRLLIAEENELKIKIYNLEGRFTGLLAEKQMFHFEPEGIALYHRPERKGTWVMVDQKDQRTHFLLFDRITLKFLGFFSGKTVANTDGITLTEQALPGFPQGALFAVHDDAGVAALPWTDIADLID